MEIEHWKVSSPDYPKSSDYAKRKANVNKTERFQNKLTLFISEVMSFVSRQLHGLKLLQRITSPAVRFSRSIGDVNKSEEVNIFDVFHTKKLQKERSAMR